MIQSELILPQLPLLQFHGKRILLSSTVPPHPFIEESLKQSELSPRIFIWNSSNIAKVSQNHYTKVQQGVWHEETSTPEHVKTKDEA